MNLKKLERYLRVNLLGPGPSPYKKIIYRAAVSQRLGNTGLEETAPVCVRQGAGLSQRRPEGGASEHNHIAAAGYRTAGATPGSFRNV
jgi:hypothetical protein